MKIIKTFSSITEWSIFAFLAILILIILTPYLPTKNAFTTYIVPSGSMEPTVKAGAVAFVTKVKPETIMPKDIITFIDPDDPNKIILHRVIEIKTDNGITFITKGDNNNTRDSWTVPAISLQGKYVTSIPYLGHVAAFIKTPKGFLIVIGIPALILLLLQIKTIIDGINEEVRKRVDKELKKKETIKLTILIFFLISLPLWFFGIKTAQALYIKKVFINNVAISVRDFLPPDAPKNLHWNNPDVSCGGTTKSFTITADWDDATDTGGSGIDHYEYNITYPKLGGGMGNWNTVVTPSQYSGVFNQDNGVHTYKVRAWDKAGNHSDWSTPCSITYDSSPPPLPTIFQWGNGKVVNSSSLIQCWSIVSDLYSNPVTYEYESYNDADHKSFRWKGTFGFGNKGTCGSFGQAILKDARGAQQGAVYYRIRTVDSLGNKSDWLNDYFFIDNTAPSNVTLHVEGSWVKEIKETVTNGGFESGTTGWKTAGDVSVLSSDTFGDYSVSPVLGASMARIGKTDGTDGNYIWDNRLMQSFPTGAKSISLWYNAITRDSVFDDPSFFIRLNGKDVFHESASSINKILDGSGIAHATDWTQWMYDLSTISDPYTNLSLYAGNTGDTDKQSWVYVDNITTYFTAAPSHATYTFTSNDPTATYFYTVDSSDEVEYTGPFIIPTDGTKATHTIQYYAVDKAGNASDVQVARIVVDSTPPETPGNFHVIDTSENSITLTWDASYDDGDTSDRVASYDLRYSKNPITTQTDFDTATKVTTLTSPKPYAPGATEQIRVEGLDPDTTYHFALTANDEAPNASPMTTTSGTTYDSVEEATAGDIIINELSFNGSSKSPDDIWLELKNTTDRTIDLSGWKLQQYVDETTDSDMYTIPDGTEIVPHGYIVISKLSAISSSLKTTNIEAPTLEFNPLHLRITLVNESGSFMDQAWDGDPIPVNYFQTGSYFYSMERTENPGDGTEKIRWYPCIDSLSKKEFFDASPYINFGTPGAQNRSENEPLVYEFLKSATISANVNEEQANATIAGTMTDTPIIKLTYNEKTHEVAFTVNSIRLFISLSWELSYETTDGVQGVIGKADLAGRDEYVKDQILLGTCSTGGTCVYHNGVKNLKLNIILYDQNGKETVLEKSL